MVSSVMSSPLGRTVYLPLLAILFCLSVASLGISASLVSHYGSLFGNSDLGSRTRLLTFAGAWDTLFGLIFLVGGPIAPKYFGTGIAWATLFVGFLIFLVGAASVTDTMSSLNHSDFDKWNLFRAQEGLSWTCTWINFFVLAVLGKIYITKDPAAYKQEIDNHA